MPQLPGGTVNLKNSIVENNGPDNCAGAITSLGEPMLDHGSHLRWADNLPGPAFSNFGLHIPALIPPCYMLFMGLEAYWIYTMIQRGINKRQFMWMFVACGLSDAIMEHPGLAMHTYEYYGNQPFKDGLFPFYWSFTNGVAICTIAVLIHFVWPRVKIVTSCPSASAASTAWRPRNFVPPRTRSFIRDTARSRG